ncbi:MAG: hypothetical protein ACREO9_02605, partial [Lysobacterales bacterium]
MNTHAFKSLFFTLVLGVVLQACNGPSSEEPAAAAPEAAVTQAEIVALAGAPLFEGMGDHQYPITTLNPWVQRYFNQGLVLDFAFNHAESVRAFKAAQKLAPDCAMCFWGEALALGPNINVTSNGKATMSEQAQRDAYAAIQKALTLKANASEKEAAFIDALAMRYNGDPATPREPQ